MNFKPYGDLVLLDLNLGTEYVNDKGIILENTIQNYVWGKVIVIGDGLPAKRTGKIPHLDIKVGDVVYVLFRKLKGTHVDGLYSGNEKVYHLYDRHDIICAKED